MSSEFAPEGSTASDMADFSAAFGDVISSAPKLKETFIVKPDKQVTILDEEDEEIEGAPPKQNLVTDEINDPLKGLEERQSAARDKYKLQKENKDLKDRLDKLEKIASEKKNPFSNMSQQDIIDQAMAAMEGDGLSQKQVEKKINEMSTEEIIAKAKEEFKRERDEEDRIKNEQSQVEQSVNTFKEGIKKFTKERSADYPLIDALGGHDSVYALIESDFAKKEQEFGFEYAQKNMLNTEQAVKKINDSLASEVRSALKSEHARKFILDAIREESGQEQKGTQSKGLFQSKDEDDYQTLTNSIHKKVTDPVDSRQMTDEEALAHAFRYL